MAQSSVAESPDHASGDETTASSFPRSRGLRTAISAVVVFHVVAVIVPPLWMQTRGPIGVSPSVNSLRGATSAYSQFMYLDRGYAFFGPDPGPSAMFQVAVQQPNGKRAEYLYPDRDRIWPRLRYHRHFMLAEFLNQTYEVPGPPEEVIRDQPVLAEDWRRRRYRYEKVRQSMLDHLAVEYRTDRVAMRRVRHLMPDYNAFRSSPMSLDDPRLYEVLADPIDAPEQGRVEDLLAPDAGEAVPAERQRDPQLPSPTNDDLTRLFESAVMPVSIHDAAKWIRVRCGDSLGMA